MKKLGLAILIFAFPLHITLSSDEPVSARHLVHLLNYIAIDYPGAVTDGVIVSKEEYAEMIEFAGRALEISRSLSETKDISDFHAKLESLRTLIEKQAAPDQVAKQAQLAAATVVTLSGLDNSPHHWPNRNRGRSVFQQNCQSCHGANGHGDGPSSGELEPKPTDFHSERMDSISPFQAFNAIRLGVPGTSMAAFAFSDAEIWDLAFYVLSLRHEAVIGDAELALGKPLSKPDISLSKMATSTDPELASLGKSAQQLALARLYTEKESSISGFATLTKRLLDDAATQYRAQDYTASRTSALLAYLDGVEPIEPRLRANVSHFVPVIEMKMALVRSAIERRSTVQEVETRVSEAKATVDEASKLLAERPSSPYLSFSMAAGIVFRECLEAALIVITLLSLIRSVGSPAAKISVHVGWLTAVGLGVLAWFFSGWLMDISGADREILEGGVSLLAVAVLLYFGFWLHRKSEIQRWTAFIAEMTKTALENKRLFAIGFVSFMAVFREAFETVLFLRAILLETGDAHAIPVLLGVLFSFTMVIGLSAAMVRLSAKIPVRQLFLVSAFLLVGLSTILLGKGIHALQEAGAVSITMLPIQFQLEWVGAYSTLETLIPQLALTLIILFFFMGKGTQSPSRAQSAS